MFDHDFDDDLFDFTQKSINPYFDPAYPEIKEGAKFTPIERGAEYSVYVIKNAHSIDNKVKAEEIIYTWLNGYYGRVNKIPFEVEIDRDDLYKHHSLACQGKKKVKPAGYNQ